VNRVKLRASPHAIEDRIRRRLAKRYNTLLEKRKLEINGVLAEFDFVSQDEQIVGQIKSSRPRRGGKHKGEVRRQTQFGDFSRDCLVLAAMKEAKTRLFVLTDRTEFEEFSKSPQYQAAKILGVETKLEPI